MHPTKVCVVHPKKKAAVLDIVAAFCHGIVIDT
jgi:hypothetical protein